MKNNRKILRAICRKKLRTKKMLSIRRCKNDEKEV